MISLLFIFAIFKIALFALGWLVEDKKATQEHSYRSTYIRKDM